VADQDAKRSFECLRPGSGRRTGLDQRAPVASRCAHRRRPDISRHRPAVHHRRGL